MNVKNTIVSFVFSQSGSDQMTDEEKQRHECKKNFLFLFSLYRYVESNPLLLGPQERTRGENNAGVEFHFKRFNVLQCGVYQIYLVKNLHFLTIRYKVRYISLVSLDSS